MQATSLQFIASYQNSSYKIDFKKDGTTIFGEQFFRSGSPYRRYTLNPSYERIEAIPPSERSSQDKRIQWLVTNHYIPIIQNEQIVFQSPRTTGNSQAIPSRVQRSLEDEKERENSDETHSLDGSVYSDTDDRETSSDRISLGQMRVDNLNMAPDGKSGDLTLSFTSKKQYKKFSRRVAEVMAQHKNYAPAKKIAHDAGLEPDIESIGWMAEAFEATAKEIQKEKGVQWEAEADPDYQNNRYRSTELTKVKTKKEAEYKKIISYLQQAFREKNILSLLENFEKAKKLRPNVFEPHLFTLILATAIANSHPKRARELINDAYHISPLQTFNYFMRFFLIPETSQNRYFEAICGLFNERFPNEVLGYRSENNKRLNVDELRRSFSNHMAGAITNIRERNFEEARVQFSRAGHFAISDKRPYIYKALIDLRKGDLLSAVKLTTDLDRLVDWSDLDQTVLFAKRFTKNLTGDPIELEKPPKHLESRLLKLSISMFSKREPIPGNFYEEMELYIWDEQSDLGWAGLLIDMIQERFEGDIENPETMVQLLRLRGLITAAAFAKLRHENQDLSEYDGRIIESDGISVEPTITLCGPNRKTKIFIDPITFEMHPETKISVLQELLEESYTAFCLLFLQKNVELDLQLAALDQAGTLPSGVTFYDPSLISLLKCVDREGSLNQKVRVLNWAAKHAQLVSPSIQKILFEYSLRWQLAQTIPCQGVHELDRAIDGCLQAFKLQPLEPNALSAAYEAWQALKSRDFSKAKSLVDSFFENWETELTEGVDMVPLRVMCLVKALINKPNIAQALPSSFNSPIHERLAYNALSLIAREGVHQPYIIPQKTIPKKILQQLCRLYVGQRIDENDQTYVDRLQKSQLPNLADLRQAQQTHSLSVPPPSMPEWVVPLRSDLRNQMVAFLEEEMTFQKARRSHNEEISNEKPSYTEDTEFIKWVKNKTDLVQQYLKDPKAVTTEIDKLKLRSNIRDLFLRELQHKAEDEKRVRELEKGMPKSLEDPGKRLWQLVELTANLVANVQQYRRNEMSYDLVVENENEARFVMQLLFEWGRETWLGSIEEFAHAFHGPEIHIWGNGPRIWHFNAGILTASNGDNKESSPAAETRSLANVHIFYR